MAAERTSRRGLFGGTFDPPHRAHLALAQAALDHLGLDAVHWVVAGQPWQKAGAITPALHREAMVRAAIAGEPRFVLDRSELERAGPSYTLDTVRALHAAHPDTEWFLILGADQHAGLPSWHGWRELLQRVTLAVANRPGASPRLDAEVAQHPHRMVPMPPLDISATEIRERAARGLPLDGRVPPAVASYIDQHGLYRRS
jgi:nicotinate-nucleotide adenylyltransferase